MTESYTSLVAGLEKLRTALAELPSLKEAEVVEKVAALEGAELTEARATAQAVRLGLQKITPTAAKKAAELRSASAVTEVGADDPPAWVAVWSR